MRRTYVMNPKRKLLQQEMILAMRQARRQISPELLEQARAAIIAAREAAPLETMDDIAAPVAPALDEAFEPIDRRKNLSSILQYMELMKDKPEQFKNIRGLLKETIQ